MKKREKCPEASRTVPAGLTGPQLRTVAALVAAGSIEGAAREAHVGRSSIYRWMGDSAFVDEVAKARTALFNETLAQLQDTSGKAVRVLAELLASKQEGVRLRAAAIVLSVAMKARESVELAERVRRLEEIIEGRPN